MTTTFPIRRVDREQAVSTEQLGSKPKFWFREGERRLLFKGEERGTGEDWAEVVASELCELLGLPHVAYEMAAVYGDDVYQHPGTVCEHLAPPPKTLILGNELLLAEDPDYPKQQRFKVRQHSRQAVSDAIWNFEPPENEERMPEPTRSAGGAFVGYLMLDAWIANTDRHHENWGVVWDGTIGRLAPTFDHGAAFAHSLKDSERQERLTTRDRNRTVEAFVQRGRSALYLSADEPKPLELLDAFSALSEYDQDASRAWLDRLTQVNLDEVARILDRVPVYRMTPVCREFTLRLLEINQQRLSELEL